MSTQVVIIREPGPKDVNVLYEMGITEEAFAVSSGTRFYQERYLANWIARPDNDILLVAEMENEIVGFLFCRVNRHAWAMLENIAVRPAKRKQGIGTTLLKECLKRLQAKGINYVASIVREGNNASIEFLTNKGFSLGNRFVWIEKHVAEKEE